MKLSWGGHIFLECISFRMTCIMGTFVLREVMLSRRTCIMGGHVSQECMSSGWYIFQDDVSYCNAYFTEHVLLSNLWTSPDEIWHMDYK